MDATPPLFVACLCAEWCGVCREFGSVFQRAASDFDGRARFAWVDVEDQADRLGGIEVDDFPTLLIGRGDTVIFFGAVLPQAPLVARVVEQALAGERAALPVTEALRSLARQLGADLV